jgi:hypothetical protein
MHNHAHAAGKQEAEQTGFIQIPGCKPDSIGAYESWIEKRIMQSQAIINLLGQSHEGDPSDTDLSNAAWGAYDLLDEAMVILSKMGDVARAGA